MKNIQDILHPKDLVKDIVKYVQVFAFDGELAARGGTCISHCSNFRASKYLFTNMYTVTKYVYYVCIHRTDHPRAAGSKRTRPRVGQRKEGRKGEEEDEEEEEEEEP